MRKWQSVVTPFQSDLYPHINTFCPNSYQRSFSLQWMAVYTRIHDLDKVQKIGDGDMLSIKWDPCGTTSKAQGTFWKRGAKRTKEPEAWEVFSKKMSFGYRRATVLGNSWAATIIWTRSEWGWTCQPFIMGRGEFHEPSPLPKTVIFFSGVATNMLPLLQQITSHTCFGKELIKLNGPYTKIK